MSSPTLPNSRPRPAPRRRPTRGDTRPAKDARPGIRPEIQALRAIAVGVVILNHSWPKAFPGGFVGVDVFFAISGFLITGHLVREADRDGGVSLIGFWARRARRILPAALLVLFGVVLATLLFVAENRWEQFFQEARASALYYENWRLSSTATDYFAAAGAVHSPVQHYWSLSVEEQFYLGWPLLVGGAALLTRAAAVRRHRRRLMVGLMALVGVASLVYSISETSSNPAAAYFITPTRVWEFALGGLLALAPVWQRHDAVRAAVSWLGLAAIAVAVFAYSSGTAFPGVAAALPVLGAVAVMAAGAPRHRLAPSLALESRPAQFVGDISYSLYLWHWPVLTLVPYALKQETISLAGKVVVIVGSLVLAWATKRWVEDPVRSGSLLARRPAGVTFGAAVAATAVVVVMTVGGIQQLDQRVEQDAKTTARTVSEHPRCFGAASRDPRNPGCVNAKLRDVVVPTPTQARKIRRPCDAVERTDVMVVCRFGRVPANPSATIALVGDSHAMHLQQSVEVVARRRNWSALLNARSHCAFSAAVADLDEPDRTECAKRNAGMEGWFSRHPEVKIAVMAQLTGGKTGVDAPAGVSQYEAQVQGYEDAWKSIPSTVQRIIVIRDTPKVRADTLDCVQNAMDRGSRTDKACSVPRGQAIGADPATVAARRTDDPRVKLVDLNSSICDPKRCYPVIGGVLAYKDPGHLTPTFAESLGPILNRDLDRPLRGFRPSATR